MAQAYSTSSILQRFFRLLAPEKKEILLIYAYAIFSGIINLSLPLGIQAIIGLTLANSLSASWLLLIVVVTLGTLAVGGIQILQISITETLQQRVFARASFEYAYRIPRLKLENIMKYYPPELINRFFDTMTIQKGLPKILIDFSSAVLQIFFGLLLLSFYHPFFVFFAFALVLLLWLIVRFTGPRGLKTSLEESDNKYRMVFWLEELARTLTTFKLAGKTDLPLRKANELAGDYIDSRKKHFRILVFQYSNIILFKTIVTAGLLVLGSLLLIQREINLGQFVASEIVIILIINSVEKLVLSADTVYDVLTATEKVGKLTDLDLENESGYSFEQITNNQPIDIQIRDLSFYLEHENRAILDSLNLDIKPGEKVCIAGHSGSGKTMLIHLLSGFYDSYSGFLGYHDVSLQNYNIQSLRSHIGECLTQKVLFRGTVAENLSMGRPEITVQDMNDTLRKLHLLETVQAMSCGLETILSPEGSHIPQTVARKLVLARCVLKQPKLILMDDFIGSFEQEEQVRVGRFVTSNPDWTLVAISNNPRFAALCDRVVVLDKGKIIDDAPLEQLATQAYYAELFGSPSK